MIHPPSSNSGASGGIACRSRDRGFPAAVCVSVNEAVVHGVPTDIPFQEGDIVGIDAGLVYKGLYTDSARTIAVGKVSGDIAHLLRVTKEALSLGIAQATIGNTTGDIGHAIQAYVESESFGIVRQLVGHGHVSVDGRRVDIPSFLVDAGHAVRLSEAARRIPTVIDEIAADRPLPEWLERDADRGGGRVARLPRRADVELPIDEHLIVSFYAR
jgi:hypothetical protein